MKQAMAPDANTTVWEAYRPLARQPRDQTVLATTTTLWINLQADERLSGPTVYVDSARWGTRIGYDGLIGFKAAQIKH